MKKILAIFCVCLALATTSLDAEAAKRIGGGGSFGRPAPTFTQKAPTPAAAPKAPQQNATSQQRQQQTAPAPKPAQKPSMMRSILTGMAAALGISALLSLLGVDSAGLASLLTGALIALALFFVVRMVLGTMAQRRASAQSEAAQAMRIPPEPRRAEPAAYASQSGIRSGSVMDQFSGESAGSGNEGTAEDVTPADFDREGFLKVALENYGKLQKAWDTGNVIEISDFTTQDVFVAITHQLRQRGHEVYHSDILELKNSLLGIAREEDVYLAAVEFRGRIRIGDETEVINEIWTLEKPAEGNGGWLLAGIKQNESED